MSKAVELAKECGFPDWWINPPESERKNGEAKRMLEAFYHAARAEALREAADELKRFEPDYNSFAYRMLHTMADRELK